MAALGAEGAVTQEALPPGARGLRGRATQEALDWIAAAEEAAHPKLVAIFLEPLGVKAEMEQPPPSLAVQLHTRAAAAVLDGLFAARRVQAAGARAQKEAALLLPAVQKTLAVAAAAAEVQLSIGLEQTGALGL
jgi:hypothetical protein